MGIYCAPRHVKYVYQQGLTPCVFCAPPCAPIGLFEKACMVIFPVCFRSTMYAATGFFIVLYLHFSCQKTCLSIKESALIKTDNFLGANARPLLQKNDR
jgi:hypothetical protein